MKLEDVISKWPENPKKAVVGLIKEYGQPQDWGKWNVIWYECLPWKRTVVTAEETPHNFPHPHTDFVEQFIDYKVPIDSVDDIVRFDGSVVVDRTRGELSARCGGTFMNFVAINLAHELVTGTKTLEGAREDYNTLYHNYQEGKKNDYTNKFVFELPNFDTRDPGVEFADLKIKK